MAAYVRAADAIGETLGCVVPLIHHCGHNGDRPRGHSSLLGAADVLIAVKRDASDNIVATVENAKDGPIGLEIASRLVSVDLGVDDEGDTMTSCVVEPVSVKEIERTPKQKLTKAAKNALRALHMTVDELGEPAPTSNHIRAGVKTVAIKQWRDFAFKTGISTSDDAHAKGTAFNRASEALIAAGKIGIWEPHVWIVFDEANK